MKVPRVAWERPGPGPPPTLDGGDDGQDESSTRWFRGVERDEVVAIDGPPPERPHNIMMTTPWQRGHCENVHRGRPEKIAECARGGASKR
jgi:hypothetical protein